MLIVRKRTDKHREEIRDSISRNRPTETRGEDVMKRSHIVLLSLSFSLWASLAASTALADTPATSPWKLDYAAAQAEAAKLNRPLIIHFYGKSCPPCKRMENEVLNRPQVLKALENGFVAVKLCLELPGNAKVAAKYDVAVVPTDVIVGPDGKILSRTSGYMPLDQYVSTMTRCEAKVAAAKKATGTSPAVANAPAKAAPQKSVVENKAPAAKSLPTAKPEQAVASTGNKLVPPPSEPKKISESAVASSKVAASKSETAAEPAHELPAVPEIAQPLVAMGGYCPVTLRTTRTWKSGSKEFAFEHDGQTFYFTAAAARDEFKSNPARYAPKLLGCDPVALADHDLAVQGNVKFGAYYDGELFLFETADSRAKFRKEPARYTRQQHVLKPEDVKRIAAKE